MKYKWFRYLVKGSESVHNYRVFLFRERLRLGLGFFRERFGFGLRLVARS